MAVFIDMPNTIYTLGYTGQKPTAIRDFVKKIGGILVDIRYSPYSRVTQWHKRSLEKLMGTGSYVHLQELGNVNYREGGIIKLHDVKRGSAKLAQLVNQKNVVLLCACEEVESCHRLVVANYMKRLLGCEVIHLKEPRLPSELMQTSLL